MAEHKIGEMDITTQEKTFASFMNWTKNATIAILCFLIFLALVAA